MEEKNKKIEQKIDKKDELRRLVLEYIGEKDIKKLDDAKLQRKKEPTFSRLEQIRVSPVKDDKKDEAENKINKEDVDIARKATLDHTQGDKVMLVKKENMKSVGAKNKKREGWKKNIKNRNRKEKEKKKTSQERKSDKKNNNLTAEDKKIKFKKKDFCIINIIALIVILFVLLFMILLLAY